ncbi:MAG: 3D domain-containing protein [Clostridiaceae bacterium]|nr:3D domain-containing protein [Clostridiaceae bacterium]
MVRKPVNAIVSQGTLATAPKIIALKSTESVITVSRGGDPLPYTKIINSKATAYASLNGATAYTASGKKAVRNPNGYSTIAVDPKVIPLGSKLFIEGYGLAYAADTGSAIKGNIIDVFFNTLAEARGWGVRYVNVYVLK